MALDGNVTLVHITSKGNSTATTIGPATTTVTAESRFTAKITGGNNQLTNVSSFTGVVIDSTITARASQSVLSWAILKRRRQR